MTEHTSGPGPRPGQSDLYVGIAAVVGGAAVIPYALSMPESEGMPGPGLFPGLVGALAVLFGLALVVKGVLRRRAPAAEGTTTRTGEPSAEAAAVASSPPEAPSADEGTAGSMVTSLATTQRARWLNAAVVLGSIVLYIVAAETLGFLVTMFVILVAIMLVLRARLMMTLVTSACLTALLYAVFELGLLVQLPDGPLGW